MGDDSESGGDWNIGGVSDIGDDSDACDDADLEAVMFVMAPLLGMTRICWR